MTKISVIIPCYNVEHHIGECLESVCGQTLKDIEIICIDDGSTDSTLSILDKYAKDKSNMRIIQQANQGSGIARNKGIDEAEGEYIAFMDADDFYPAMDVLEKIYNTAKQNGAEICGGSLCTFRNGVYAYDNLYNGFLFSEEGWISKEQYPTHGGYLRLIYKKSLIEQNHIYFPDYLRCQDVPFFLTAVACAGRVYRIKQVTYAYRKGHKQLLLTERKGVDYVKGIRDSLIISKREGMQIVYKGLLKLIHGEISAMLYLGGMSDENVREIIHQYNQIISDEIEKGMEVPLIEEKEEIEAYVKSAKSEMRSLLDMIIKENTVLIYGAGMVGKLVLDFLKDNKISPEAFVVSNTEQNATSMDGLQIRCIDEYINIKDECMVIIATFAYLHDEIMKTLNKKGFKNVHILSLEKFHLFMGKVVH